MLAGMSDIEAYIAAGGRAKTDTGRRTCVSEILTKHDISEYLSSMGKAAADAVHCTTEAIVRRLMYEAGITAQGLPEDTTPAGRIAALKLLTDYTGGFDKNKQKIEHAGYIELSENDLYDDA